METCHQPTVSEALNMGLGEIVELCGTCKSKESKEWPLKIVEVKVYKEMG